MPALAPTVRQLPTVPRLPGPLRFAALVAAVAIAVAMFASAFVGSASAATTNRQVITQSHSFLFINDDESWPFSDETQTFDMSNLAWGVVSPANQLQERGVSRCAGDEVRVEYQMRTLLSQTSPGSVTVMISAQLYEGDDCFSRSLDGSNTTSLTLAPGETVGRTLVVADNAGDYGQIHLVLKNAPA